MSSSKSPSLIVKVYEVSSTRGDASNLGKNPRKNWAFSSVLVSSCASITLAGAPSFVTEPPSDEIKRDPSRLEVFKDYVRNIARWLGARADHNANARENGDVRAPRSAARAEG